MRERRWSWARDKLRKRRLAFDHYTCQACGWRDPTGKSLRLDELVPIELGGKETWDNSGTLCWSCNGIKGMSLMSYDEVRVARERMGMAPGPRLRTEPTLSFFRQQHTLDQAQPIISPRRRTIWR
jgi:hypothetical protein